MSNKMTQVPDMGIIEDRQGFLLTSRGPCDLGKSLHSGQAFRWKRTGGRHEGVVRGRLLMLEQHGAFEVLLLRPCTIDDARLAYDYLALDLDQEGIEGSLSLDGGHMYEAVNLSTGLRTLRQEPWETLIAFIISANNGVTNITRVIDNLCLLYGDAVEGPNGPYHVFPRPEQLMVAGHEGIWACKAGFRTRGICEAAAGVAEGRIDLEGIAGSDYAQAKAKLMKLHGIGEKVADCILLFSMDKPEAFPVDVWIERIVRLLYFDGMKISGSAIRKWASIRYGNLAGYANQFLFNYGRKFAASELRSMDKASKQEDACIET
jgi:N-glycosylase/DNA lyase